MAATEWIHVYGSIPKRSRQQKKETFVFILLFVSRFPSQRPRSAITLGNAECLSPVEVSRLQQPTSLFTFPFSLPLPPPRLPPPTPPTPTPPPLLPPPIRSLVVIAQQSELSLSNIVLPFECVVRWRSIELCAAGGRARYMCALCVVQCANRVDGVLVSHRSCHWTDRYSKAKSLAFHSRLSQKEREREREREEIETESERERER